MSPKKVKNEDVFIYIRNGGSLMSVHEEVVETQHLQPLDVEVEAQREATPQSSVMPYRRPRGLTRGLNVQVMVEKDGKLVIPIPQYYRAPVGNHASKLALKIGVEVRTHLPDLSIRRWKYVNEEVKAPMIQHLTDQFDMEGESLDVKKTVTTMFGQSLSTLTYRLRQKYLKLKNSKGEEYARSHPSPECDLEKWEGLIDKKWNDSTWLEKSKANIENRKKLKTKHRCGSKSLPVRVHEARIANGGQLPELPIIYKSTHFNDVTQQWISPECEINYDNMIKMQADRCSQPGAVSITPVELSVKVLKARSGYVKGIGLRPSSSLRITAAYTDNDSYVRRLEREIQEQKEEIQAQKNEIEAQKEEIQAQNNVIAKINESNERHLEMTSSIMEFLKKQGFNGQFRGGGNP